MAFFSKQRELYEQGAQPQQFQSFVTIGTVVDTNDPQQMGRVRIVCQQWGDSMQADVDDIPWAVYMTPFGGHRQVGSRGPGIQESSGSIAYGAWMIPDIGAQAIVVCVDGNPMHRLYMGCIYDQFVPHTLPHGRFMYDDHPELEKDGDDPAPYGPYTSTEQFIQPFAKNMKQAFGNQGEPNYEYRNRGADYTATRLDISNLDQTWSKVQDDKDITHDGWTSTQGYQQSRVDPDAPSSITDKNYDNMVYSLTSPGFHSLSMDDRQENCRVRFRTTSGTQILLDDTNERIYIATAKGNNWIELDQDGNIDVYTTNKISMHADKEINFTSNETIRFYAKKGIHMRSEDEIRVESLKDLHVRSYQNIRMHSQQSLYLESNQDMHAKSSASIYIDAVSNINNRAAQNIRLQSGGTTNIRATGSIVGTGAAVYWNEQPSDPADPAQPAKEQPAYWTNRVPLHEPWARTMTKDDLSHTPEFGYTDSSVNKSERGRSIDRGKYWRR